MKKQLKIIEVSELSEKPTDKGTYIYKGILVPCPECEKCKIKDCKFVKK